MRDQIVVRSCLWAACWALLVSLALPGCASRREQLERVAKDWCETIRASQVIPVYPPTADLLPGDMFLVDRPVREQHTEWEEKGFLALPFELPRLAHTDRSDRYLARRWGMFHTDDAPEGAVRKAPPAAFPSYSFSVANGGSFDLALPVQGVPVGLSALATSNANGTISMKDVQTYALDQLELGRAVREYWNGASGEAKQRQDLLREFKRSVGYGPLYVRAVNRVYGVRTFNITISSASSRGASASAGAGSPASLAVDAARADPTTSAAEQLNETSRNLGTAADGSTNALTDDATLGVHTQFVAASARSVSLVDTFDEPIVVGYLALDFPVGNDGSLGLPVPTFDVLDRGVDPEVARRGASTRWQAELEDERALLEGRGLDPSVLARVYERAARTLGVRPRIAFENAMRAEPENPREAFLQAVRQLMERDAQAGTWETERVYREATRALRNAIVWTDLEPEGADDAPPATQSDGGEG
ncbi:MAG: hypothetical protein ACF8Q5_10305 [Phycisphaerales bacterium JB040]